MRHRTRRAIREMLATVAFVAAVTLACIGLARLLAWVGL
jgi:hypothetical protein